MPKGISNRDAVACIEGSREFSNSTGSLRGEWLAYMPTETGRMAEDDRNTLQADYRAAEGASLYVVWSYGTPIAWRCKDLVRVPVARHSQTTAKHLAAVRRAWAEN